MPPLTVYPPPTNAELQVELLKEISQILKLILQELKCKNNTNQN